MQLGKTAGRLGLVLAGTVVGLLLLEGVLQVAASRQARDRSPSRWVTTRRRVLTLGDSNTYGLFVTRAQAYPKVLERTWNRMRPDQPIEVLNAGYPGMNSSRVRNALPALLRTLRPDLVLVMVGVNDIWTLPEPIVDQATPADWQETLWRRSRVYRLLFMLGRSIRRTPLEVEGETIEPRARQATLRYGGTTFDMGYRTPETGQEVEGVNLFKNLRELASIARAAETRLAFVTYPTGGLGYGQVSNYLRRAASATGSELIDVGIAFTGRCRRRGRCRWLFPDGHPTVGGHRIVGTVVARALRHAGPAI